MNISPRKIILVGGTSVALVAAGAFLGAPQQALSHATGFFGNPAIKWGAILSAIIGATIGALYLLANKDALKRKVTEYGEVSFLVVNGNPRCYKRGSRKGELMLRWEGQAKNVIPKLRDQVTISWLLNILRMDNLESMYRGRRLGYELAIEFRLPNPKDENGNVVAENVEVLRAIAFDFRDRNRYNEEEGTFEAHLKYRSIEAIARLLPNLQPDEQGVPTINPDEIDWLRLVHLDNGVRLESLRVSLFNLRFTSQIELK